MTDMDEAQRGVNSLGPSKENTQTVHVDSITQMPPAQARESGGPFLRAYTAYRDAGWMGTLPLPLGQKFPPPSGYTGYDGAWPSDDQSMKWARSKQNIALRLPNNVIGIDVDQYGDKKGAEQLAELETLLGQLPPTWSSTRRGQGDSRIRFYRVPEGRRWPTKANTDIEVIQYGHRYAVVWPSELDEDGRQYYWYQPDGTLATRVPRIAELTELPASWVDDPNAWGWPRLQPTKADCGATGGSRSKRALLDLLSDDPGRGNDWLAKVCGILAPAVATGMLHEDEAMGFVKAVDAASDTPHEATRLEQTWRSVLRGERKNHPDRGESLRLRQMSAAKLAAQVGSVEPALTQASAPVTVDKSVALDFSEDNGHLRDRIEEFGYEALIKEATTDDEGRQQKALTAVFGDFKLRAKSMHEQDGVITWVVDFICKDGSVKTDREITSDILSNNAALKRWVMGNGGLLRYNNPTNTDKGDAGTRLQALLMSQDPPRCEIVDYLGWNERLGVFVADQGTLQPGISAVDPYTRIRPTKFAIEHSRSRYGVKVGCKEAIEVFREVLTFHDETAASVVGSWAVMAVLRGHLNAQVFPTLKVDGTAESGKSKFLQQVLSLVGSTGTGGGWTKATARTALGTNSSGIVWFDDCDGLTGDIQELLRQAATGGDATNRDVSDLSKLQITKFRASAVISSEGLGTFFNSQKANRDRMVTVHFPDPKGRKSRHNPDRPQWDDVVALWVDRWGGDYTQLAGSLVSAILELAPMLSQLKGLNKTSSRRSQTDSLMIMGSMILARLTGDDFHIDRIQSWIDNQEDLGNASVIVLQVIPTLWRQHMWPKNSQDPSGKWINPGAPVPVFLDGSTDTFWVNVTRMADQWAERKDRNERMDSLTNEAAINSELTNIGCKGNGVAKRMGASGRPRYREIPAQYSQLIKDKAGL